MSRSLANQRLRLSRPIMAWHRASFRNIPAGMVGRKGRGGGGYDGRVGNSRRTPDACGTRRRRMDRYEDLERSLDPHRAEELEAAVAEVAGRLRLRGIAVTGAEDSDDLANLLAAVERFELAVEAQDRKSTRLNSSHSQISYAVFCLKKKKKKIKEYTLAE